MVLISAHRCGYAELGAGGAADRHLENTLEGLSYAARIGADYVEFDVRRTRDGTFVISHDPTAGPDDAPMTIRRTDWADLQRAVPGMLLLDDFLDALAGTGLGAHVDAKLATPAAQREQGQVWEHDLLERLVARLDPASIIVTTGNGDATGAIRDWVEARGLPIRIGLSIGSSVSGLPWRQVVLSVYGQLFPRQRYEISRADAVAAHYALAVARLTRWTFRLGVPLLVWTVDDPRLQRRLLHDRRVWMITTNWPARAVALRTEPRRRRWYRD